MKNWFCLTVEEFRSLHRTASKQSGRKYEIPGVWLPLDLKVKHYNLVIEWGYQSYLYGGRLIPSLQASDFPQADGLIPVYLGNVP